MDTSKPFASMVNINEVLKEINTIIKEDFKLPLNVKLDLTPEHERIIIYSDITNRAKEFYDRYAYSLKSVIFEGYDCMDNNCYWDTIDDLYEVYLCLEKVNFIFYKGENNKLHIGGRSKSQDRFSLKEAKEAILKLLNGLYNYISIKEISKDVRFSTHEDCNDTLLRACIVCSDMDTFYQVGSELCEMEIGYDIDYGVESNLGYAIAQGVVEKPSTWCGFPCVQVFVWCSRD